MNYFILNPLSNHLFAKGFSYLFSLEISISKEKGSHWLSQALVNMFTIQILKATFESTFETFNKQL